MQTVRRLLPRWGPRRASLVAALAVLVSGLARPASAEGPALVMEEPRSGLRLEVPGGCQVKPAGDAACTSFAASAHQAERFAVVLHDGGLLSYSIAMFAEPEPGAGEERARRVARSLGEGTPSLVTFGGQSFLRAELRPASGAALCFVTIDDRPEVAIVMFASEPALADAMKTHAEAAMRSVRRIGAPVRPSPRPTRALAWGLLVPLLLIVRFVRRHVRRRAASR